MHYEKTARAALPQRSEARIHRLRKGCVVKQKSQPLTRSSPNRSLEGGKRTKHESQPTRTKRAPAGCRPLLLSSDMIKTVGPAICGGALGSGWLRFVFGSLAPFPTAVWAGSCYIERAIHAHHTNQHERTVVNDARSQNKHRALPEQRLVSGTCG